MAGATGDAAAGPPPPPDERRAVPATYGAFLGHKSGMDGSDPDHVRRVVYETSVGERESGGGCGAGRCFFACRPSSFLLSSPGSAHFENERRREKELEARLAALKLKAASLPPAAVAAAQRAADSRSATLLASRDTGRACVVADMDQFFLACHALADPSLLTRCVAVGSKDMISTASYAARAHGVRSAMPGFIAMRLCPGLEFVAPDFELYKAEAVKVRAVFARFDPDFHPMGLDEAALDLTVYCAASSLTPATAAEALRAAVRAETGLAVSCGVAPNRLLAKVASDTAKPDGVFVVPRDPAALAAYVAALPTRRVPGIGRVTEATLAALGVATCSQLHAARGVVGCLFGKATSDFLLAASLGASPERAGGDDRGGGRKGLSAERTFAATDDPAILEAKIAELAAAVAARASSEGLRPRAVGLKIKLASFEIISRQASLPPGPPAAAAVAAAAVRLFLGEPRARVRLLGVRLSAFDGDRPPGQASVADLLAQAAGGTAATTTPAGSPARGEERPASPPRPPPRALLPPPAKTWACLACTYADTPSFSLRCSVCDTVRGAREPDAVAATAAATKPRGKRRAPAATLARFLKPKNREGGGG